MSVLLTLIVMLLTICRVIELFVQLDDIAVRAVPVEFVASAVETEDQSPRRLRRRVGG